MTRAFRYVEDVEWADIVECGTLRPGRNSCGTGKWIARAEADAWRWGQALDERYPGRVLVLELDATIVESAYLIDNLDHIGPAFYVGGADIAQMQIVGVVERK